MCVSTNWCHRGASAFDGHCKALRQVAEDELRRAKVLTHEQGLNHLAFKVLRNIPKFQDKTNEPTFSSGSSSCSARHQPAGYRGSWSENDGHPASNEIHRSVNSSESNSGAG